jgi:hypothetical protein
LQEKSQNQETLKGFLRQAQNKFGLRIKKIRSDNGTEFKNSQIEGFLEEERIKHEFSSPYTPQQNGVVDRKNRTLLYMARTMFDEYKTPNRFWAKAINTACYSINRLYLHRILKKTSYELLTGKKSNFSYFRVFGSKCFILIKRGRSSKFAPKAVEDFLLGYELPFAITHVTLNGMTLHSYLYYHLGEGIRPQRGRKMTKGLSSSLFLALNAKWGEILSPKQKDHTTISKKIEMNLSIGVSFN